MDKQGEIAILQTQGVLNPSTFYLYLSRFIGWTSGHIDCAVLGVLITLNLGAIFGGQSERCFLPTSIEPGASHYCDCLFFIVIFIINHLSSLSCGKTEPAEALRYE